LSLPPKKPVHKEFILKFFKTFETFIPFPPNGIYNVGSENNLSTYDVAKVVLEKMGLKDRIEEILIKDVERYKTLNKDLRISNSKLKNKGICFTDTEEAVCKCVEDFLFQV
jgi:dTDP-4-dehydrorhamnose reductase